MIRACNLGQAEFINGWFGLHIFDDGVVRLMYKSRTGEWFPSMPYDPPECMVDALLKHNAVAGIDYGEPTFLERLRGKRTRKAVEDLRQQLADVIERKRKDLRDLELARLQAIK